MTLKLVEGCVNSSISVDGIEETDLTEKQRLDTIDALHAWMKEHPECLNTILQDVIPQYGTYYTYDIICEQCGSLTEEWTLNI
jgi:hypothetical protein